MKLRIVFAALLALALSVTLHAAVTGSLGTATVEYFAPNSVSYRMAFTSDASAGSVGEINVTLRAGTLVSVKYVPVTSGGTQPTNLADLTLLDRDGMDLLSGRGADLVNTGPTEILFDPPYPYNGKPLTPTLTNAGNSKAGQLVFVVRY